MATYIRKDDDVKYRKVPLKSANVPAFKSFETLGEGVTYNEDQVIEVEDNNGKRTIYYAFPKLVEKGAAWSKANTAEGCRVTISADISPARLWINARGALYKIPIDLPIEAGCYYLTMAMRANDFSVEGDEYFKAAYGAAD